LECLSIDISPELSDQAGHVRANHRRDAL
jgi:hypothetical protein